MNIFYLDTCPQAAAAYHCDKHVVKMIVETTQLLCTAVNVLGGNAPYKIAYLNHPSNVWCRKSLANFRWLRKLGLALCYEYFVRYKKEHKCKEIILSLKYPSFKDIYWSDPPQCMPEQYKQEDTVEAYRAYYRGEKSKFAVWKYSKKPEWF